MSIECFVYVDTNYVKIKIQAIHAKATIDQVLLNMSHGQATIFTPVTQRF